MVRDDPSDADKRAQNDAESIRDYVTTRRRLLAGTAGIGAAMLAGCQGSDSSGTSTEPATAMDTDTPTETPSETETSTAEPLHPDVDVLNYALTLEHLEHAFYRDGLDTFAEDELTNADVLEPFGETVRMEVPDRMATIRDHEQAHVETIVEVVGQLGGDAVGEAAYDFGYETPSEFLAVAKALENTGVAAYKGAAPAVTSNDVLPSALAVHSVEARHASFLNLLTDSSPFPRAFGEAKSMDEVIDIAGDFITTELGDLGGRAGEDPTADRKMEDDNSDVDVLNYALTLEHLEHAFYRDGLEMFADDDITGADVLSEFDDDLRTSVPDRLAVIRDHEKAHVDAIGETVEKLGGTPVEEAAYDFGYETPSEFLAVGKALENTGVAAYAGAAPTVENDGVFEAAAAIHDVEARHASFLNELNTASPFPDAFDGAKTMDEVTEIASRFITSE
ncbi:Ferritin-like domain-containing protein [Halomicrobium zhouii]|uniref:Ferritin-like domain-containing protein n=1 Tax=Halomicrobium zhouii TaxID=767519 RepID=A0A1I6LW43_9EURY|nr:ferritin-like domain-containing protein [Halomicrobium zhouii]SFS07649.1 Ferritin-like domain-containing protein [Halomicrobium zhouii]